MKNLKFVTSQSYKCNEPRCFEHISGPSETIQGESYTVRELFQRHISGQILNLERPSYWEDTQDFDAIDFQAFKYADPVDKMQILEEVQFKAAKAKAAIEAWNKENESFENDSDNDEKPSSSRSKKSESEPAASGEQGSKRSGATDANSDAADKTGK